ncbi:hypothetical protein RJ55_05339 [Drechmeria coniospora]|nr:hypothetical protein RJ55_05339 [Drechmeria coniospora]
MFLRILFVALARVALSAPQGGTSVEVTINMNSHFGTSEDTISVLEAATKKVIASSCSRSLSGGSFEGHPISANFDQHGQGNITIGAKTYTIHEDPKISGGMTCDRMYTSQELYITCDVSVPSDVAAGHKLNRRDTNCLKLAKRNGNGVPGLADIAAGHMNGVRNVQLGKRAGPRETEMQAHNASRDATSAAARAGAKTLDARIIPGCSAWELTTDKIGNGDPHQNYNAKQLSRKISCFGAKSCSVSENQSKSYTLTWSASSDVVKWISAGFSVSETWTTGSAHTCGGGRGDTVCIWYQTAFTAYTVQNRNVNFQCQKSMPLGGPKIIWSPNTNNVGGLGYYCVSGARFCHDQGSNYWTYDGPAGGPREREVCSTC